LLEAAKPRFEQIACSFTTFNPQLAMRGRWEEAERR
jgi:hypothetical protein